MCKILTDWETTVSYRSLPVPLKIESDQVGQHILDELSKLLLYLLNLLWR